MARATKTSNSTRPRAAAETPKRKPGRPIGSVSTKKPAPAASAKTVKPSARRGALAQPASRIAKPNKAELEIQLGKLERTLARLREKNKELKQIANEAREHADTLEAQLAAKPVTKSVPKSADKPAKSAAASPASPRKSRRPASKPEPETVAEDGALGESGGATPEA